MYNTLYSIKIGILKQETASVLVMFSEAATPAVKS